MCSYARSVLLAILLLAMTPVHVFAQSDQRQGTGVITGRVMLGDKGVPNVVVQLFSAERSQRGRGTVARATTDYEGRYKLLNVPPGGYSVTAVAPAYVGPGEGLYGEPGRTVNMAEGETIENIDFVLRRGGVITGRVTDAEGAPVIAERIQLKPVEKNAQGRGGRSPLMEYFMSETDDRGIYRLFGLAPGRYTVSVGESGEEGEIRYRPGKRGYYARTFHPAATDESKATVIEVNEGSEVTNVDITLGRTSQAFSVTGRVLDENGKPAVNVRVGGGTVAKDRRQMASLGFMSMTDAEGRFRFDGLLPGQYAAFVWNDGQRESYSDATTFQITDADVSGLEVKLRLGASISGVAVIEGTMDKTVLAKLSEMALWASPMSEERLYVPSYSPVKVAPDGSFRITGLQPSKVMIYLANYPPVKGFNLARVERDGAPVQAIEIARGADITGVRVVIEYGAGSLRGIVKVENGVLPEGTRMFVYARRTADATGNYPFNARVDARGTFVLEGLPTGEYEIILNTHIPSGTMRRLPQLRQKVSVTSGVESTITLTLDLNAKPTEGAGK